MYTKNGQRPEDETRPRVAKRPSKLIKPRVQYHRDGEGAYGEGGAQERVSL